MAGKSWQPSDEPPHSKRTQTPVTLLKQWKEGGKAVGGELPARWAATTKLPEELLLYVGHATIHEHIKFQQIGIMSKLLTTRGTQELFVVNLVKLHLTALHMQDFFPCLFYAMPYKILWPTQSMWHVWCMMGRLGVLWNRQQLSFFLIGCIFYGTCMV